MWVGQRGEDRDEIATLVRRQARRRLVEQDEARRAGERQRNFELALLTMRQFADESIGNRFEVNERDEIRHRLHDGVARPRADEREAAARDAAAGQINVLANGEVGEQQRDLVGATKSAADAFVRRQPCHVLAEKTHRSRRRRKIAGHAIEQRRFAGTVRSEHGAPLARPHAERDIDQCRECAEKPTDPAQLDSVAGPGCGHPFGDRAQWFVLRSEARARAAKRRQRPITPSGENRTMTRKPRPIRV